MNFAERQRFEQETQKTEQNDAKTVEIKRGDLHDITAKIMIEDESTAKLTTKSPLLILAFMILTEKIEERLFEKEE